MNKIQEVKERADIVKVAEYFGIKAKQCCPFHKEKTPSFSISKSKQIWKCFGCDKGRRRNKPCRRAITYKCL